jgi:acyl carrier protein
MGEKPKTNEEISQEIEDVIKDALELQNIKYSIKEFSLDELAVDSLRSVELIFRLEEYLGINNIEPELHDGTQCQWSHKTTVKEIIEFIKRLKEEAV